MNGARKFRDAREPHHHANIISYAAFAVFGWFWGAWGGSVPAVSDQARVDEGQLGVALLFVAVGALPAMAIAGRVVDRHGRAVLVVALPALSMSGLAVAWGARDQATLIVLLTVTGAASGAADVGINAYAASAEGASGHPLITRSHAAFSATVVAASLTSAGVQAAGLSLVTAFVPGGAVAIAAATALVRNPIWPGRSAHGEQPTAPDGPSVALLIPLTVLGGVGALAFAVENAHQNWSALFAADELRLGASAAAAPALFAGTVAVCRTLAAPFVSARPRATLGVGSTTAASGTALVAIADTVTVAAVGLVAAAAGTAVLFPALMVLVTRLTPTARLGRATSVLTMVSYLGFLLGPVYVGLWAQAYDLRTAFLAVAALGVAVTVGALVSPLLTSSPATSPASSRTSGPTPFAAPEACPGCEQHTAESRRCTTGSALCPSNPVRDARNMTNTLPENLTEATSHDTSAAAAYFATKLAFAIDPADVSKDMAAGPLPYQIVDSRGDVAWSQGRIPGALHLPTAQIEARAASVLDADRMVVVYCWGPGCDGSTRAALALSRLGFNVKELLGGFEYWVREGLAVHTDRGTLTSRPDPLTAPLLPVDANTVTTIGCDC